MILTTTTYQPEQVHSTLKRHMLADGYPLVLDMNRSEGVWIYDRVTGKRFFDFFSFFASIPLGMNHPKMKSDAAFLDRLMEAALNKVSNPDVYTEHLARFVDTFSRVGIPEALPHLFLIEGGALANENAIKAAIDWKVRKNFQKGYRIEKGHQVLHFEQAFHGRSGYTMSLTNTDPNKVALFPKFNWPRVVSPNCNELWSQEALALVAQREALALAQIKQHFIENRDDIAAIIIEPIQAEGGDNHFRPEFLQALRQIADEQEAMLIFDEVQTGVGLTGSFWAYQSLGVTPDMVTFGKKMQVCGFLASNRILEVPDNVFVKSSRINSTWGGNLADMVRAGRILEIIEEDELVAQAAEVGRHLLSELKSLTQAFECVTMPRGRGLMCAFDLPTAAIRDRFRAACYEAGIMILGCGERSIRFRPSLNITQAEVSEGISMLGEVLKKVC